MDSYKKDNPKSEKPKQPEPGAEGRADSFQSSRTAPLSRLGSTRRLGSASLPADQVLTALQGELENGELLMSKLHSRIVVLERAVALMQRPMEAPKLFAGVSPGETGFTRQVTLALEESPQILRRVQVALFQWSQARQGLETARAAWDQAQGLAGRELEVHVEQHCQVEKLRGQLYPLINLHVVFKDHPLISQLIPTPKTPVSPPPAAPLPPGSASQSGSGRLPPQPRPGTGRLELPGVSVPPAQEPTAPSTPVPGPSETASADAAVQALKSGLKAVTGGLRNRLIDLLGGTPKDPST